MIPKVEDAVSSVASGAAVVEVVVVGVWVFVSVGFMEAVTHRVLVDGSSRAEDTGTTAVLDTITTSVDTGRSGCVVLAIGGTAGGPK